MLAVLYAQLLLLCLSTCEHVLGQAGYVKDAMFAALLLCVLTHCGSFQQLGEKTQLILGQPHSMQMQSENCKLTHSVDE